MCTFSVIIFANNAWLEVHCDMYFNYIDELKSLHRAFNFFYDIVYFVKNNFIHIYCKAPSFTSPLSQTVREDVSLINLIW